jgi:hypothetical protein
MRPRFSHLVVTLLVLTATVRAADPPAATSTPNAELDRLAVEVLKDLHNRGADLYNAADAPGALRLYEATLRSVGPFLAHRPKVQAAIADGLAEAFKLDGAKAQAYRLHELIDQVRNDLKTATKVVPEVKLGERKGDPTPGDGKTEGKSAPNPDAPPAPVVGTLAGKLTLDGMPVPKAAVTLVSLTLPKPRVFTAQSTADGTFTFTDLPPANYSLMVTGGAKPLPGKYESTQTSRLEVVVKAGSNTSDVNLQSK